VIKGSQPRILIPARLNAQRLPGKPLMDIQGKPMVVRVAEACIQAVGRELVTVSTPDQEIQEICLKYGIDVIVSSTLCESGTDRLVEYAKSFNDDLLINVQGDEPMIPPEIVEDFYNHFMNVAKTCIAVSRIFDDKVLQSRSVVKVATSENRLIYASRLPIGMNQGESSTTYFKHTGLYGFTRNDLLQFGSFNRGPLELFENVEILRLLERGIPVEVYEVANFGRAVDSLEDYIFVNKYGRFSS